MRRHAMKIAGMGAYIPIDHIKEGKTHSQMAVPAIQEALKTSGLAINDIDVIVNVSETFERIMPEGGTLIQAALGLGDSGIPCMTVQNGWQGFIQALVNSMCWIENGRFQNILVVASEIYTRIIDSEDECTSKYYKDAACAAVLVPAERDQLTGAYDAVIKNDAEMPGAVSAFSLGAISSGKTGKALCIELDLEAIINKGSELIRKMAEPYIEHVGHVSYVVGQYLNDSYTHFLKETFKESQILTEKKYSGCGTAEIPLVLYEAIKSGKIVRGDTVLLAGTGTGITSGIVKLIY